MEQAEILVRWLGGLANVEVPEISPLLVIFLVGLVLGALWAQGRCQED